MAKLIDGKWTQEGYKADEKGRFVRDDTTFRNRIGSPEFPAEAGRYHLYVSLACPWAHRTLIVRKLKGLEDAISVSAVEPYMGENGWTFSDYPGATPDHVNGVDHVWQLYVKAQPGVTARATVPILWDKKTQTIVNNESREIVRMLDDEFEGIAKTKVSLLPPGTEEASERFANEMYPALNNGVYRAGFAKSQEAYEEAARGVFALLDRYEDVLANQRFLTGNLLTEADVFLFTTLYRFDPVYSVHFKCNLRRIVDYPNLFGFLRDIYQLPGIAETSNLRHVKEHYYQSHPFVNPSRIVPIGPEVDLDAPHDRARFGGGLFQR